MASLRNMVFFRDKNFLDTKLCVLNTFPYSCYAIFAGSKQSNEYVSFVRAFFLNGWGL